MSEPEFRVLDASAARHAASPTLQFRIGVRSAARAIDAMMLRVRLQIEPWRRAYAGGERALLTDLSLGQPVQWADVAVAVGAFSNETVFEVPIACTYDLHVASTKYLSALCNGEIPLRAFFNGTIFRGTESGFEVEMLAWDAGCEAVLPLATWRQAMDACFPSQAWIRMDRTVFDALLRYRNRHACTGWEQTFAKLLESRCEESV